MCAADRKLRSLVYGSSAGSADVSAFCGQQILAGGSAAAWAGCGMEHFPLQDFA
jgi:hypothetical protein